MRLPIWFGSNASIQRGAPTPAQAEGIAPAGVVGGGAQTPVAPLAADQFVWFTPADNDVIQRGAPEIDYRMARRTLMWNVPPMPVGGYHVLRHYDWGAEGFGYVPGQITTNPIGAGVVATNRAGQATREPGQVGQVVNNSVTFFSLQNVNWGIQPSTSPIYSPDVLRQLLGPLATPAALPDALPF